MKKQQLIYWVFTVIFIYWMFQPTVSSAFRYDYAVDFFTKRLGFPAYFLAFTGFTKLIGLVVLLIPGFPRIKEWVYAGFAFDLTAAIYSLVAVGMPVISLWVQTLALALLAGSYIYFHKTRNLSTKTI